VTTVGAPSAAPEVTSAASSPPVAETERNLDGVRSRLLRARTGVLVLVVGGITLISVFSYVPIRAQGGLVFDRELVFYLSGQTAHGALPLVDFQHGWNAGGWWVGALLYRVADGSPNVFAFLFEHVFGRILAFSALAVAVWRLPRSAALIAVVGIGSAAWAVAAPPNAKYAIPALWLFVLLPTPSMRRSRRRGLVIYAAVAFVTLWLHVELAVLLAAGVAYFELLGVERDPLRVRLQRIGALAGGLALGVLSELAFYATQGVSVSTVNDYVFGGQAGAFPQQYGWALTNPTSLPAALFPLLLLAPFVPALWRRAAPETRLAACLSLATAIVAIRRHDPQHLAAVSTLFVFTGALLADDVHHARAPVEARGTRGRSVGMLAAGGLWAAAVVLVAFETESLLAEVALMGGAAVATLASRRGDWPWASGGAVVVCMLIALVGSASVLRDRIRSTDPQTQIRTNAQAIAPEVDRCLGGDRRAVIAPTQLSLYGFLRLENPTPYVEFRYDFVRYAPTLVDRMQAGDVPAFIQTYPLREWMSDVRDELADDYVACSRVSVPATGDTITIWVDADRAPAAQRELSVQPDGSLVSLDGAATP
jgi:hypothetical protein